MEKKFRLLLLLALLLTAATGAWAQEPATTYSVKMKDGTVDAKNWTIASGEKSAKGDAADGLTGLSEGDKVTLKYNGRLKVKGVKATSDAAPAVKPAATVTTAPTGAAIVGVGKTTALVSGGVADGGTLMYAVTTTNTKPTSTAGFSDAVPTAEGRAAGNYYVWYYAKGDADHSDSEIAGPVSVTMEVAAFILGGEGIVTNSRLQFTFLTNNDFEINVWADWNGTSFTCDHGSGEWYGDAGARVSVNGAVISLGVSDDWDDTDYEGFTVNFNTSNNTYTIAKGMYDPLPNDVTSVKVNGVEVKGNLTKQ